MVEVDTHEVLDVVDEHDHVVTQLERGEVHRQGLMHRACHIVLSNSRRQVLVQLRALHKQSNPGLWDTSAAGHVEAGESYRASAVRELEEELGVQVLPDDLQHFGRLPPSADTGMEHVALYHAVSDAPIRRQVSEIDAVRWASPADLDAWIAAEPEVFTSVFCNIWHLIRGNLTA